METNSVDFFNKNRYQLPINITAPIIVGWELRTPENYGNLIRLADTVGCKKVVFVSNDIKVSDRKIRKTAGDSYNHMVMEFVSEDQIGKCIPEEYQWIALETAENSTNIYKTLLPEAIALFVGNEQRGIPDFVLERFQSIVHIPLTGRCTSLNVSHACAIALFEWVRQHYK